MSNGPTQFNFEMVSGDTKTLRCEVVDVKKQPFVLTGTDTIRWAIGKTAKSPPIVQKSLADGSIRFFADVDNKWWIEVDLDAVDTEALSGAYFHECEFRMGGDDTVVTAYQGTITILDDLNR